MLICDKLCSADVFGQEIKLLKPGDSVTLNSGLTEMKDDDEIQWRFGYENTLIAEINKRVNNLTVNDDVLDERFRDRLKLNNQTGSLTITDITTEHVGLYVMESKSVRKSFFLNIIDEISMKEGDSVTLNSGLTEIMDDKIQWRFRSENILIAEIDKQTNSMTVYDDVLDGRFRNRLKLNKQTGSLTITNTTTQHAGAYELDINNVRKRFLLAVYGELKICSTCFIFFITRYNIILHTVLLISVCSVVLYYYSFGDYI
uniref:Immunoglobulin domain-containing protein n=1 Tax=Cyprinus carpio TaxID=7962 RepID=A0A8C1SWW5_CYPCA